MPLRRLLGDDQRQKDRDGLTIGRIERHGSSRSYEYASCRVALVHPRVRNGDTVTQPRRAQLLARGQALQDLCFRQAMPPGKQAGDLHEQISLG